MACSLGGMEQDCTSGGGYGSGGDGVPATCCNCGKSGHTGPCAEASDGEYGGAYYSSGEEFGNDQETW
jgi:hypothetical protein